MRPKIHLDELETKLNAIYTNLAVPSPERIILDTRLQALRKHHRPTWEHSLRVAIYTMDVANAVISKKATPSFNLLKNIEVPNVTVPKQIEPSGLFYPAISHDFGKTNIRLELLEKKVGWNKQDAIEMQKHTELGVQMAKAYFFEFSAYVIQNIHSFDKKNLKPLIKNPDFSDRTNLLMLEYSSLINIVDYYDAATYRLDDRNSPGVSRYLEPEEVQHSLLRDREDEKEFIHELYNLQIF